MGVGIPLHLLENAGDVEDDVLVRDEAIRGEEMLEGFPELALLVALNADLEMELRLVRQAIGADRAPAKQSCAERDGNEDARKTAALRGARLRRHVHRGFGTPFNGSC